MTASEPTPTNREWLEKYTNVLLSAGDLADRLKTHRKPVAQDIFYRVSDPRVIDLIIAPEIFSSLELRSIVLQYSITYEGGERSFSPFMTYEFLEGDAFVGMDEISDGEHAIHYVACDSLDGEVQTVKHGINDKDLVSTVARLIRPSSDPSRVMYEGLGDEKLLDDVTAILDQNDLVTKSKITVYEIDGHEVIVTEDNDRLVEISLRQDIETDEECSIAMRVSYLDSSHSIEFFRTDHDGREPIPASEQEVSAFGDIIDDILEQIDSEQASGINIIPVQEQLCTEGFCINLPEERRSRE